MGTSTALATPGGQLLVDPAKARLAQTHPLDYDRATLRRYLGAPSTMTLPDGTQNYIPYISHVNGVHIDAKAISEGVFIQRDRLPICLIADLEMLLTEKDLLKLLKRYIKFL
ncbi:unnamed protein product, partial [Amoebophrya sp. A25]|eukprot:GSA25T00015002001.1